MADNDTISAENLNFLLNNGKEVVEILQAAATGSASFEEQLKSLSNQLTNTNAGFGANADKSALLKRSVIDTGSAILALTTNSKNSGSAFDTMAQHSSDATAKLSENAKEIGGITARIRGFFDAFGANNPLSKLGTLLGDNLEGIIKATNRVQGMEQGIVSLGAATGNLDEIFGQDGGLSKSIDQTFQKFNNDILKTSEATGIGVGTIMEASKNLGRVPEALRTSVSSGTQVMSELTAATKIAAATGRNISDVTDGIARSYENLNLKGQDAVDFLSSMADVSSKLHLPLDVTNKSIEDLANSYSFLTNNTDGAIKAFARFVPALQNTGLSPQKSIDMFKQMAHAVGEMGTAEKAFLAQRSGMGSGLQGAFKIDKMVQDGKLDEVMQMMQKNLQRQFGGRTVTLDDAATNQRDAVQYQRQLQYVKNSAFGNLVKDDKEASKLFKAMQSGDFQKEGAAVLTGNAATQEITTRGTAMQDRNRTVISTISTQVERIAMSNDQQLAALTRLVGGTAEGSRIGQTLKDEAEKATAATGLVEKPLTTDVKNNTVDQLLALTSAFRGLKEGYLGSKDQFGHAVREQEKVPAAHGPKGTTHNPPLNEAIRQSVEGSSAKSSVTASTLQAATDTKYQGSAQVRGMAPAPLQVTGKIEGICFNCKTQMDVGHIHNAVSQAVEDVAERDRQKIGSPARR